MKTLKAILLIATLLPGMASADYQCKNNEAGIELNLLMFEESLGLFANPEPAAAVLNSEHGIELYKGTSTTIQTRLGQNIAFDLSSENGTTFQYNLIHSQTSGDVNFNNCTRAGCDPIIIKTDEVFGELITIDGTQYELTCKSVYL